MTKKICAITGARGWVGSCAAAHFRRAGWEVRELIREPSAEAVARGEAARFVLGEPVAPEALAGVQALVHCAYDFRPRAWAEIVSVNVNGSAALFAAARQAGVGEIVLISTMSAFEDARSDYGRAKMLIEAKAREAGARIVRPGLVWGDEPGGMFGSLVKQVRGARVLPVFSGGVQTLYLVHGHDLGDFILRCCEGGVPAFSRPLTAAHPRGWTLREILAEIARGLGKTVRLVPVPWLPVWILLKMLESCGVRLGFRSDSLFSLTHQNPHPDFSENERLKLACRPFQFGA